MKDIRNIPLKIGIGPNNKNETLESIEGKIINCSLAANTPHLPAFAEFQTTDGKIRIFTFFEIKWIMKL